VLKDVKPEVIFHLAGAVGADTTLERVLPTYHSLLTSTVNLLSAATEYGCQRIILIGSLTEPLPSSPNPIPQAPYAAAKWAASAYGRMFHALHSTPVVILRPFMTYGPGQHPSKLIPSVIRSFLRDAAPKVASGRTKADWIYVSDVIDAFLTASSAPGLNGATLDLGTGNLTTVKSVIAELAATIGTDAIPLFGALPDRPFENETAANTAPAAERLGWRATTSLKDGLRQTVDWYRSQLS
jgi:nucleoside-diphosphate-sugar epimerase